MIVPNTPNTPSLTGYATPAIIIHDEYEMGWPNVYRGSIELHGDDDVGVLIASDNEDSWSDFTGYLFILRKRHGDIRVTRYTNGSLSSFSEENFDFSTTDHYVFDVDYRSDEGNAVSLTVYNNDMTELGSVSLNDTAHDRGYAGFYQFSDDGDWYIDQLRLEELFDHDPAIEADVELLPGLSFAEGRSFNATGLETGSAIVSLDRTESHAVGGALETTSAKTFALGASESQATGGEFEAMAHPHPMIVVGEDETFTKRFDVDETWGNTGIDVSAPGAAYDIFCDKGGVTIENVGIYGHVEDDSDSRFRVEVTENVAEPTVVRNVYLPGVETPTHNKAGPKVFSHPDHEGHISFEGVTIRNHPDGGLRLAGSGIADPEHPNEPGGGTYTVENCYVTGCGLANVSIASDGTSVEHSFIADAHSSAGGLWAPHGDASTVTVDDTVLVGNPTDIRVGGGQWATADDDITVAASNSRWVTDTTHASGTLVGSPVGETFYLEPNDVGAPNSPEQAAKNETPAADPPASSGITLETLEPSTVGYVSATLVGEIEGHHESAEVGFEWKSEMETPTEEFVGDGTFDQHVSGLEPGETYTVRATAATDGGAYIRGGWVTFETHESPGSVRERFDDGLDAYEGDTDGFEIVGDE